jgi:hypothetical protein
MATKPTPTKKPVLASKDPAIVANERILAARSERIIRQELESSLDLGLNLQQDSTADSAVEFLKDEWDRKAFGDEIKTISRTVYGPDPIVNNCPEFHERLERYGLAAVAEAFRTLIMTKEEMACPDAIMRKGVKASIRQFGKEATADAFRDRILRIPSHVVEIETDTNLDPMLSNPMRVAVEKYLEPGFSVKFLSERCMDVLGMRGYEIVKDKRGDPVRIGTLYMGQIPKEWAERRRQHFADLSTDAVKEQEDAFYDRAAEKIASEGKKGMSASILQRGESMRDDPAVNDLYKGETRTTGIDLE